MLRDVIAMVVVVALSGCAPRTSTPPSPVAPIPGDAIPTESNFIHGRATYLERIKIPPGADFTVQLIDNQLADTPQAQAATRRGVRRHAGFVAFAALFLTSLWALSGAHFFWPLIPLVFLVMGLMRHARYGRYRHEYAYRHQVAPWNAPTYR